MADNKVEFTLCYFFHCKLCKTTRNKYFLFCSKRCFHRFLAKGVFICIRLLTEVVPLNLNWNLSCLEKIKNLFSTYIDQKNYITTTTTTTTAAATDVTTRTAVEVLDGCTCSNKSNNSQKASVFGKAAWLRLNICSQRVDCKSTDTLTSNV